MKLALLVVAIACSLFMSSATAQEAAGVAPWRAEAQDNICGVSNPRQVTNPAVVDYAKALKATPEMQDLVARGIDPQSAEGQILRQRAVDHVRRVSSKVMRRNGHCSIWKTIKHRSGRNAPELTQELVASIGMSAVAMESGRQGYGETNLSPEVLERWSDWPQAARRLDVVATRPLQTSRGDLAVLRA